jgi:low affinity Fe/Cu permease
MNRNQQAPQPAAKSRHSWFDRLSGAVARFASSRWGFGMAVFVVALWAVLGPILHYSSAWQLTINTGTTIVTFLMVFLLQGSQDRGTRAIQLKLDELILAKGGASNSLVNVEELCEEDLLALQKRLSEVAKAFPGTDARSAHPPDPAKP